MNAPGVVVACDALRSDTGIWKNVSEDFRRAAMLADQLTLTATLGPFAGAVGIPEIVTNYEDLRHKVIALLASGGTVFDEIATLLLRVADTYEQEDLAGYHEIKKAGGDE